MLAEFICAIRDLSVKAASPQVRSNVTDDAVLIYPDGHQDFIHGKPQRRNHIACDLTAICAASQEDREELHHTVWYSRKAVVLIYDDKERRDRMTLTLEEHPVLTKFRELERSKQAFSQVEFVRLFRVWFDRYCHELNVLETIRRISFRKNEEGESEIRHGKASVGRSLQAELAGVREIPEHVVLQVPIFTGKSLEETVCVDCVIDIDPAKETFQLYPFPGEIDTALCEAEESLYTHLAAGCADGARIYYGAP